MFRQNGVEIIKANGKNTEYIIKDTYGINMGRIYVLDFNKENKYCCIRMKFYKKDDKYENHLKQSIVMIIEKICKEQLVHKMTFITNEDINVSPFVQLGFMLEGMIQDSVINNGVYENELLFGIDINAFKNSNNINVFRLRGNRIELKILTPEDSKDVYEYYVRNKDYLKPFEPSRDADFYTLKGQRELLMEGYKQFLNDTSVNFGIYKDKKFIGKIQLSNIVLGVFHNAFVGYSIDEKYQKNGYMKEALNLVLDYAFDDMDLHRIEASTLVDNIPSQCVLKGCGFEEVGVSKRYLFINGKWRDHKIFYITKE